MNDNAKKWVATLRSDKYKQAKAYLRTGDDRFCCLGVACDLAVDAGVLEEGKRLANFYRYSDGDKVRMGVLPDSVQQWLGLATNDGEYLSEGKKSQLVAVNDAGASFDEIANIIDSEPDGLFKI